VIFFEDQIGLLNRHFGISKKFRNVRDCLKGVGPFKGDSEAMRLPGQGASALLRVPHGQAGLRSTRGAKAPMEKLATEGS
jgi:hypothetical protein